MIALRWDTDTGSADLSIEGNDLATDAGLEAAIMLSLYTDRRAEDGDTLPDADTNRRGWWGDAVPTVDGDRHGSRLWLLQREKMSESTRARAEEYAREALQWLVDDLVADRVDVAAVILSDSMLGIGVTIRRPAQAADSRFDYTWQAQSLR